ncbi:DNA packaging protein [Profundibacter sp.]
MRIVQELPGLERGQALHCVGGSDLCDLFDITPAMLTQLVKRGIAIRLGRNSYDLEQSTRNYVKHLRGVASGRGGEEQNLTLTGERARLARAQADAQELKNAALRKELVKADEVERRWADILRSLRARILAMPSRLRGTLDLSPEQVQRIDRELRDTLSELGHGND